MQRNDWMMMAASSGRVMLTVLLVAVVLVLLGASYFAYLSATAKAPATLGLRPDRTLAAVSERPNSVSTFATDDAHKARPYDYVGSSESAWKKLKQTIEELPSAKIVKETEEYMHVEFTSRLFRFVDDVEFVLDPANRKIQFKSASRVGHSDMGVNRGRMEDIRLRFGAKTP